MGDVLRVVKLNPHCVRYMETLLPELIQLIIGDDPAVYRGLALAWPAFARKALERINYYKERFTKLEETNGNKVWMLCGRLHRDDDRPAVIYADGSRSWWVNGKMHRENDQPARVDIDGYCAWLAHSKLHRDHDQPAMIYASGRREWWTDGKMHRDNDQPAVIHADGSQEWWEHGVRTR